MSEALHPGSPARIAVVHDWLVDYAGSERVLAEILRCLPQRRSSPSRPRSARSERKYSCWSQA